MQKKNLLIFLMFIMAGIIIYNLGLFDLNAWERDPAEPSFTRSSRLRLDLLDRKAEPYTGVKRDIFSLQLPSQKVTAAPSEPEPDPVLPEPVPAQSELQIFASQASYFGLLDKPAGRTVFIRSGSELLTVKKGDLIGAHFRVEEISDGELVLKDSMTGEEARITLQNGRQEMPHSSKETAPSPTY